MLVVLAVFELASIALLTACAGGGSETEHRNAIAFTVNDDGFGEIWLMDSDGGNPMRLTPPGPPGTDASGSTSPAWSSDGDHIAFVSSGDGVVEDQRLLEIYTMSADGSDMRRLTNDRALDGTPAWSPDGRRIAFAHLSEVGTGDVDGVIVVIDADGQDRVQVTRHPRMPGGVVDMHPVWSPDGSRIAFTRGTLSPSGLARATIYTSIQRAAPNVSSSRMQLSLHGPQKEAASSSRASATATARRASTSAARAVSSTLPTLTERASDDSRGTRQTITPPRGHPTASGSRSSPIGRTGASTRTRSTSSGWTAASCGGSRRTMSGTSSQTGADDP